MTRLAPLLKRILVAALVAGLSAGAAPAARAQPEESGPQQIRIDRAAGAMRDLGLEVGQSRLLMLTEPLLRASVADPRVADIKVITQTQILLTARGVGATDLTFWNKREEPMVIALRVDRNLEPLRKQLKDLFPHESLVVTAAGELVLLSGEVGDVRVPDRAVDVAKLHADKVANLIRVRGHQQVQLEVKFAEVSRNGLRQLSVNMFHQDRDGRFVGGVAGSGTQPGQFLNVPGTGGPGVPPINGPNLASSFSLFFSGIPRFPFSAMVSLLESSGLAKILAEPTLVAMSGQEARFLAGGEFPIPLSSGLGAVSVSWKKFGIILNFTPTVIDEKTINLKLAAEVSDVDFGRAVTIGGSVIPGVTSRQSETTVRLGDGQSFAIAGLLSDRMRSNIDRVPFLGEIPILGALFRSVSYRREESELLVVVTARLTRPLAPHEVPPLPTEDELNDPNDLQLFLFGMEGRRPPPRDEPARQPGAKEEAPAPSSPIPHARGPRRGPAGQVGFIR